MHLPITLRQGAKRHYITLTYEMNLKQSLVCKACRDVKKKPMTARDVTGFFAFSLSRNRAIFSRFWGDSLLNYTGKLRGKEKRTLEKIQKTQCRKFPEIPDCVACCGRMFPELSLSEYSHVMK